MMWDGFSSSLMASPEGQKRLRVATKEWRHLVLVRAVGMQAGGRHMTNTFHQEEPDSLATTNYAKSQLEFWCFFNPLKSSAGL